MALHANLPMTPTGLPLANAYIKIEHIEMDLITGSVMALVGFYNGQVDRQNDVRYKRNQISHELEDLKKEFVQKREAYIAKRQAYEAAEANQKTLIQSITEKVFKKNKKKKAAEQEDETIPEVPEISPKEIDEAAKNLLETEKLLTQKYQAAEALQGALPIFTLKMNFENYDQQPLLPWLYNQIKQQKIEYAIPGQTPFEIDLREAESV